MNEQRLVEEILLKHALRYVGMLEKELGKDYEYARGFRDCLEFLSLVEEKSPQSGNSKGTRCK